MASDDPTQDCAQGFCFRGAEKIYELMQQKGIGDKKMWGTELGWITQPPITPTNCLNTSTWEGRAWQIVSDTKQASNLARAYQYADANWPYGCDVCFNLDFNQDPALPECEQMRYYSIFGKPAYDALTNTPKNPGFIPGRLKADPGQLSYRIEAIDQPLTFTLGISLSKNIQLTNKGISLTSSVFFILSFVSLDSEYIYGHTFSPNESQSF